MAADSPRSPRRAVRLPRTAAGSRPGGPYGGGAAASAAASSSAATAASRTRPPILLELSSTWVRAGFVGHIAAPQITLCHLPPPHPQAPASEWYRYYSPILQDATSYVLDGLATGATATTSSSTSASAIEHGRRVLIIYHGMPHVGKNQLHALRRVLLDEYNIPAMSVQPAMKMAFYAAAMTTTTSATMAAAGTALSVTTPLEHGMIVYVHGDEAYCVAVAHSRALDHTYQATGSTTSGNGSSHDGPVTTLQQNWEQCWKKHFLNAESPHSLVMCMVRCVEACARDDRHRVVANLVFCGDWFLSDPAKVQQFVAQQLRKALTPTDARSTPWVVQKPAVDETSTEARGKDPSAERAIPTSSDPDPMLWSFTHRAISSGLRTQRLADSVGVALAPTIPCEVLPWVGANVWAKHWYSVHPDAPAFQWETKQS